MYPLPAAATLRQPLHLTCVRSPSNPTQLSAARTNEHSDEPLLVLLLVQKRPAQQRYATAICSSLVHHNLIIREVNRDPPQRVFTSAGSVNNTI